MSYEYYTSDLRRHTITTDGTEVTWGTPPETGRWYGSVEGWEFRPYQPTTSSIPVIRRKPKRDPWKKYTDGMKKIREVKEISEATKRIEIRPVIVCGWCGAPIPREKKDDPCEYCGK